MRFIYTLLCNSILCMDILFGSKKKPKSTHKYKFGSGPGSGKSTYWVFSWTRGSRFESGSYPRPDPEYPKCLVYIVYIWIFQICFGITYIF